MAGIIPVDSATDRRVAAPWLDHYPDCVPRHLGYPDEPAWVLLDRAVRAAPDRLAICYQQQRLTYRELWDQVESTAGRLTAMGVVPGDRVALLLPNLPEYLVALHAIWLIGGTAVAASPLMAPAEIESLLAATGSRVVVTLDLLAGLIPAGESAPHSALVVTLGDRLPLLKRPGHALARFLRYSWGRPRGTTRWHDWGSAVGAPPIGGSMTSTCSPEDPALILPTGGTTGRPRAVVLCHRNLVANAWQLYHWSGRRTAKDTVLGLLPFFHSYGLTTVAMCGIAMQATLVLHHRFNPGHALELFERHRPTVFPAVPTMLVALNDELRRTGRRIRGLKHTISGGAGLPIDVADEFSDRSWSVVVEGYGLSEAGPVTHVGPLDHTNRPGTIGLPLPDTEARIVGVDDDRELPPGEVGQLLVRGPQVMTGYLDDPAATAAVLDDDGWLATGDLAVTDSDGFFRIVDRLKDLVITNGMNVYPGEVEEVLRQFPAVADAAVIGVPDRKRGQRVKAVLALHQGAKYDRRALEAFLDQNLAHFKRPKEIEVVRGDLPRNFLGKVLRRRLREDN